MVHYKTALELAEMIRNRDISAVELLDICLSRVDRFNLDLNAVIWMDRSRAKARAEAADAALQKGENWGAFHGVPMTIKESFNITGAPTTWGDPEFSKNVASSDATLAMRMQNAGAILYGKTNVPLNLADWQSFNAIYGTTNNPWDLSRTPGGSSGGSGVALATGMSALEAGSDIGASIRNPAHYCGVFGHKPTYNIVPGTGQALPGMHAGHDITVVGPLARSAEDLETCLQITAGPDGMEAAGWRLELPAARQKSLKDFRVAFMFDAPDSAVDTEYQGKLQAVADKLAACGATVSDKARPDLDLGRSHEVYIRLLRAATSGRTPEATVEAFRRERDRLAGDDPSYYARMVQSVTMPHRDWLALNNERAVMRKVWADFFEDWDILVTPSAASAAFPHDQEGERHNRTIPVNGEDVPVTDQMFWAGFSGVVYLPSTVGPIGLSSDGLPLSHQAIAGYMQDLTSLRFTQLLAQEIGGFVPPPNYS